MLGSAISFLGYWLVLGCLVLWMVVRIWRRSPLLAVATFLLWPLALLALVTNWGDEESDIRVPFALSLVACALMVFMAQRTVDKGIAEAALVMSDADIAMVRAEDPDLAMQLEMARAEAIEAGELEPWQDVEWSQEGADRSGEDADARPERAVAPSPAQSATPTAAALAAQDPALQQAAHASNLTLAVANLSWRFGTVSFEPPGATLPLPRHFRFAPRQSLVRLANLTGRPLPPDVLGWLVHEKVDLTREDAWYAEVRFRPLAQPVAAIDPLLTDGERAAAEAAFVARVASALLGAEAPLESPRWNAAAATAHWQQPDQVEASTRGASVAARLLPGGILAFVVPDLHVVHRELGERTVRLMARRTRPPAL